MQVSWITGTFPTLCVVVTGIFYDLPSQWKELVASCKQRRHQETQLSSRFIDSRLMESQHFVGLPLGVEPSVDGRILAEDVDHRRSRWRHFEQLDDFFRDTLLVLDESGWEWRKVFGGGEGALGETGYLSDREDGVLGWRWVVWKQVTVAS